MRNHNYRYALIVLLLTIGMVSCTEQENTEEPNSSEFVEGADGWTIAGDASGGSNVDAAYSPFDGLDNSGYIYAEDEVTGGVWYFAAPSKYHGDKSGYTGGTMTFWLIQESDMDDQFNSKDVIFESDNGNQIYHYHDEYPGLDWTFYSISLDTAGSWMNSNDQPASMSEIEAVLSDISGLWIRGEYQTGPDTGGLDRFRLME